MIHTSINNYGSLQRIRLVLRVDGWVCVRNVWWYRHLIIIIIIIFRSWSLNEGRLIWNLAQKYRWYIFQVNSQELLDENITISFSYLKPICWMKRNDAGWLEQRRQTSPLLKLNAVRTLPAFFSFKCFCSFPRLFSSVLVLWVAPLQSFCQEGN